MIVLNPQFIKDNAGNNLVILQKKEYNLLLEELEDLEDVKLYDEAKNEDDGKRILLSYYVKKRRVAI